MSTARCRAGRYCRQAIRPRRRLSRATAMAAGSSAGPVTSASGIGLSQLTSGPAATGAPAGSSLGAPRPEGSARRPRCSSAVRQALVAIRYSQTRSDERPSNPACDRQARRKVSWTRSSASSSEPSIR